MIESPFNASPLMTKQYSLAARKESAKRMVKARVQVVINDGTEIVGNFYLPNNVRPSDYLRDKETDRLLITDATINKKKLDNPILVIISNCRFIILLDKHVDIKDK